MTRVLKCFVTPTLTYTAQVDECVSHICIETQLIIGYMCRTCFASTASDTRIFSIALLHRLYHIPLKSTKEVHVCFDTHQIFEYMC